MSGAEFVVSYAPQTALANQARWRGAIRQRLVSLVISIGIGVAIWYFYRDTFGSSLAWIIGFPAATGLAWLLFAVGGWLIARSETRRVGLGPALAVSRAGLWIADRSLTWPEVGAVRAAPKSFGRSADLVVDARDGQSVAVPLDYLSALPATVDSAIRALSSGRTWIDLSRLDD